MICRCVIFGGRPGWVQVREVNDLGTLIRYVPCPECSGDGVVSCCDGAVGNSCDIGNTGEVVPSVRIELTTSALQRRRSTH